MASPARSPAPGPRVPELEFDPGYYDRLKGLLRGLGEGAFTGLAGGPVDLANLALTPLGLGSAKPVLGSEDIRQRLVDLGVYQPRTGKPEEGLGEFAGALLAPGPDPAQWAALGLGGIIRAYHGTGAAPFERFSDQFIGKGQGAATYGKGHYLAENIGVAEDYRRSLVAPKVLVGGQPVKNLDEQRIATQIAHGTKVVDKLGEFDRQIAALQGNITKAEEAGKPLSGLYYGKLNDARRNRDKWAAFQDQEVKIEEPPGTILTTDVDVEPEDLLDWDLPLTQQPEKVRKALEGLGFTREALGPEYGTLSGDQIYNRARPFLGKVDESSAALRAAGIPGLRYLDQGSREAGEGTRNLVIFDPGLIKILEARIGGLGSKF